VVEAGVEAWCFDPEKFSRLWRFQGGFPPLSLNNPVQQQM
jgi:hypothetical protein